MSPSTGSNEALRIRKAILAFNESDFARLLSMNVVEAHDGFARVTMDCSGKMNPHKVAHGGAIFSLADHAFGIAANCNGVDRVAVSVHIQYISPATGSLTAVAERVAERVADNGKYSTFRVKVSEAERLIAEFNGVALQVNRER